MSDTQNLPIRTFWPTERTHFMDLIVHNFVAISALVGAELVPLPCAIRKSEQGICDLLARNRSDNSITLIEMQISPADEDHWIRLAQYACDHAARMIIWIAENFSKEMIAIIEEHNRRPDAPFRVLAIACRVPALLPLKPYFEVIVRPTSDDAFPLNIASCAGKLHPSAPLWAMLQILYPDEIRRSWQSRQNVRFRLKSVGGWRVWWGVYGDEVRLWLSPEGKHDFTKSIVDLQPHAGLLEARLGVKLQCEKTGLTALTRRGIFARTARNWCVLAEWLHEQADAYEAALCELQVAPLAAARR